MKTSLWSKCGLDEIPVDWDSLHVFELVNGHRPDDDHEELST